MTKTVVERAASKANGLADAAKRAARILRFRSSFFSKFVGRRRNDTAYLTSSPANAERLRAALASSRAGEGMQVSIDELRSRAGLG